MNNANSKLSSAAIRGKANDILIKAFISEFMDADDYENNYIAFLKEFKFSIYKNAILKNNGIEIVELNNEHLEQIKNTQKDNILGLYSHEYKKIIYRHRSIEEDNFLIAHELGHAFLHKTTQVDYQQKSQNNLRNWNYLSETAKLQEKEANQFAYELLMPVHSFIFVVKNNGIDLENLMFNQKPFSKYLNFNSATACLRNIQSDWSDFYQVISQIASQYEVAPVRILKRIKYLLR